jgi:hypothetical protein
MPVAICCVRNGIMPAIIMGTITRIKMVIFDMLDSDNTARRLAVFRQNLSGRWDVSDSGVNRKWWVLVDQPRLSLFGPARYRPNLLFLSFEKDREVEQKMCAFWLVGYDR